jgi:hypothetical protein
MSEVDPPKHALSYEPPPRRTNLWQRPATSLTAIGVSFIFLLLTDFLGYPRHPSQIAFLTGIASGLSGIGLILAALIRRKMNRQMAVICIACALGLIGLYTMYLVCV